MIGVFVVVSHIVIECVLNILQFLQQLRDGFGEQGHNVVHAAGAVVRFRHLADNFLPFQCDQPLGGKSHAVCSVWCSGTSHASVAATASARSYGDVAGSVKAFQIGTAGEKATALRNPEVPQADLLG